jgi:uncharacterized protein
MLDTSLLQAAVSRMADAASSPVRIILFGSQARGSADSGSDVDLLVIERRIEDKAAEYMRLCDALGRVQPGVAVDVLLYDESEYLRRSQVPGNVLHRARSEGRVLHDSLR